MDVAPVCDSMTSHNRVSDDMKESIYIVVLYFSKQPPQGLMSELNFFKKRFTNWRGVLSNKNIYRLLSENI